MDQPASPGLAERQKIAMRVSAAFAAVGYQVIQYSKFQGSRRTAFL
jgi:hypothetical protein